MHAHSIPPDPPTSEPDAPPPPPPQPDLPPPDVEDPPAPASTPPVREPGRSPPEVVRNTRSSLLGAP